MKSKPDPNEFARQVLFHVCGIHAEVQIVLHMMSRQTHEDIAECDKIFLQWGAEIKKIHAKLYHESLAKAGIPLTEEPPESPTER